MRKVLIFLIFCMPFISFSQDVVLQNIATPGGTSMSTINGAILGENLIGPRRVLFSGDYLQKEQSNKSSINFGIQVPNIDKLTTFYSGRIFSPGIIEPFVFENLTPEQLVNLEITVFPVHLEQLYSLYVDLVISVTSKTISSKQLDEAGHYKARISISLLKI